MRKCKECSYEQNIQDYTPCPRCGGNNFSFSNENSHATQRSADHFDFEISNDIRKTIAGKQVFLSDRDVKSCPKCKYNLVALSDSCPNCGFEFDVVNSAGVMSNHQKVTISISNFEKLNNEPHNCSIELIPIGEKGKNVTIDFANATVHQLSRNDIDEKDDSISTNSHLQLMIIGDKLVIKNLASNQALFKLIKDEETLISDDIILIGRNKYYKVKIN